MLTSRRIVALVARSLAGALLFGIPIAAQSPGIPLQQPGLDRGQSNSRFPSQQGDPIINAEMEAKRIKAINQIRHRAMVDDAAKLLLLATQLNDDSANLSPADRVHKAAEIEKLAKSVKDKMSYVVGNGSAPSPPPFFDIVR